MLVCILINCSSGHDKEIISEIKKYLVSEVNWVIRHDDIFIKITREVLAFIKYY